MTRYEKAKLGLSLAGTMLIAPAAITVVAAGAMMLATAITFGSYAYAMSTRDKP